ncbi:MAG: hypothetical protein RBR43_10335 [Desulfuromonadaceae bacterium]|nr:hypothetical protein [Desulfuromonadaceae bacterium]
MFFKIIGDIQQVETFATGSGIRELQRLNKQYGKGRWRKRKGIACIQLGSGQQYLAEIHWYEASGIGKKEVKIKYLLKKIMEMQI